MGSWFNETGFKNKQKESDKRSVKPISEIIDTLGDGIVFSLVSQALRGIHDLRAVKCYRRELLRSFTTALVTAESNGTTVLEAMTDSRNSVRRMGRKVGGKCIGTTLLTKGLEFDAVAVLDAHKFDCPKHLYVALTRASKRLVVFSSVPVLTPNGLP